MTAEAVLVLEEISIFTLIVDILMNVNETVKIGRVFFVSIEFTVRSKLTSYMCLLHQTLASHLTCPVTKSHVQWSIH